MPRDTLSRDQIIDAALDLLDAEGFEGFNMRTLGERLGSAATAVYWHVGSKENLIALAGDRVWSRMSLPDFAAGWRPAAAAMASDLHATLIQHLWLVQAFGTHFIYGPGKARYDEHGLALFESAGFTLDEANKAASVLFTYVLGNVLGPAAAASMTRKLGLEGGKAGSLMAEQMAKAREIAAQFPRLRTQLETASAGYSAAADDSFAFGLEAILDGIEAVLTRRSGWGPD